MSFGGIGRDGTERFWDGDELPRSLRAEPRLAREWQELSRLVQQARLGLRPTTVNSELERSAEREQAAPTAPAYRLWIADNFAAEGRWEEAIRACDATVDAAHEAGDLVEGLDVAAAARHRLAECAAASGQVDFALASWRQITASEPASEASVEAGVAAGLLAETTGREEDAAEFYSLNAAPELAAGVSGGQLARRALMRLEDADRVVLPSVGACHAQVNRALEDRDQRSLEELLSRSHFAVGFIGGHFRFEDAAMRERLLTELAAGPVAKGGSLLGSGQKRYAFSDGWDGRLLRGTVGFVFTKGPRGWEWTGVALTEPTDEWMNRLSGGSDARNQPLPFPLKAPWPAGLSFMAGGLADFAVKAAAVAAAGPLAGGLLALGFARSDCGFGPRGFYYNDVSDTHQDEDAFAIDFTRYRHGVPFDNESGGTAVLAPAAGVVVTARGSRPSGDPNFSNTVELRHPDPVTGDDDRYLSRYLHLAGPSQLSVSDGMAVIVGQRLGTMNDTGNSVLDHLHFSIHDQTESVPGASRGASVRPTPMDGTALRDGDGGACVLSSNRERRPPPLDDAEFVRQQVPSTMRPLTPATVSVTMQNSGPTTWTPGYRLESLFQGWSISRVPIGQTVAPAEDMQVEFELASLSSGDFTFQWQMARPFGGRFGEATQRRTVQVNAPGDGSVCDRLDRELSAAQVEADSWQDMLDTAAGQQKAEIIAQLRRVQGQISALEEQKRRAGCP